MVEEDHTLLVMLALKNNWALTGDYMTGSGAKSVQFSTRWYDSNIQLPQVVISPGWGSYSYPTETGLNPTIQHQDSLLVNLWVRPIQDSNTSLGSAKNIIYQLRREVERIISGSLLIGSTDSNPPFVHIGPRWRRLDDTSVSPPILREELVITSNYIRKRK